MATSKVVVTEFKVTFDGTAYDCRSIPAGIIETCEPPDVTVGTDDEQRATTAALTEDGDIQVEIAGTPPEINSSGALAMNLKTSTAGAAAVSKTITVGNAIVTALEPSSIEAGGDRVQWWTVTFKPDGTRT